ncbi:MAG: hypothetical protein D3920_16205 [Candidatus Electrothrix sp. AW2]|nr:hypothetical protein [Candidatus Electrothrix gigas]
MSLEIHFTSEEYDCPVTQCMETVKIKHSTKHVRSVDADTLGQPVGEGNTRKKLEDCTGIDECGVKKDLCPFIKKN